MYFVAVKDKNNEEIPIYQKNGAPNLNIFTCRKIYLFLILHENVQFHLICQILIYTQKNTYMDFLLSKEEKKRGPHAITKVN